jgi:hypothetical protein
MKLSLCLFCAENQELLPHKAAIPCNIWWLPHLQTLQSKLVDGISLSKREMWVTWTMIWRVPRTTGPGVAQWLRHCATNRTVSESIPGGVTGFFSDISPSNRTVALGSTQSLVKMSTRNIPGGKGGRCVRLTTSPSLRAECHEIWEPKPPGTLWATLGLLQDSFTFYHVPQL